MGQNSQEMNARCVNSDFPDSNFLLLLLTLENDHDV